MADEVKTCPHCGKEAKLVMVMYVTKSYSETAKICPECRKKWLKKLRELVGRTR